MIIEKNNIIKKENDYYIVLATANYNNRLYLYVNKLINERATNNYKIFKIVDDVIESENNTVIIRQLLPGFEQQFSDDMMNDMNNEKYGVGE